MRQRFRRITDARPSAPPPTSKLTDERAAHAEAISAPVMNGKLRPWWGVATRLDRLLETKVLSVVLVTVWHSFLGDSHGLAETLREYADLLDRGEWRKPPPIKH